jgi:hypothetical protein
MKTIAAANRRVLFTGQIHSGIGQHDYLCGRCGSVILKCVDVRHPSLAAFQCCACEGLNIVARLEAAPEEVTARFTRLYGDLNYRARTGE